MPITYAGIPLTPTAESAQAAATAWWHGHRLDQFQFQGYTQPNAQHLPVPFWPQREPPRIGVLSWPTGADRYALCQLAITGAQRTQLLRAIGSSPSAQSLVFSDGSTTITAPMYVVGLTPISQRADSKEYYLLSLTDERYFWWMSGAQSTPSSFSSWADLLGQLFTGISVTPVIETIPSAYLTPTNARWNLGVEPIPLIIEACARTIGSRVVRSRAGVVTVQRATAAQTADAARWLQIRYQVLSGGQVPASDVALGLPAECVTQFFDGSAASVTLASLGLSTVTGVTGRYARVAADTSSPTAGQRTAYAAQAAQDYYQWAMAPTDATIRGFADIEPCGYDEAVEWVHTDTAMVTRVLRSPWADNNIYGGLAFGQGSGSGTGSGTGSGPWTPCDAGIDPVTVSCDNGRRVLTSKTLGLVPDGNTLVLQECEETETDLGPCSPDHPDGTTTALVRKVCPVYANCVTVTAADSPYQITGDDTKIVVDTSDGEVELLLPEWSVSDEWFTIIFADNTNALFLTAADGETVNGITTEELDSQWSIWTVEALCEAGGWAAAGTGTGGGGGGTVTSVGLTVPPGYTVTGSPVTTFGTLAVTLTDAATARTGLGLGTAAVADTGTSGHTLPFLDGANTFSAAQAITVTDAVTNTTTSILTLGHESTGTPVSPFGGTLDLKLESSTTSAQNAARLRWAWLDATHASRKGIAFLEAADDTATWRTGVTVGTSGSAPTLGFLTATAVVRQTGDVGTAAVTFGLMSGTPTFAAANLTGTTLPSSIVTSSLTTVGTISSGTWQGTVITVTYGGSGRGTATAYAVICGGTTSTGAHQSIASVGTAGQVLTSAGAGALPTMSDTITATSGESVLASTFVITAAANTYEASGLTFTLPSAGTYKIFSQIRGELQPGAAGTHFISGKLRNTTDSTDVTNGIVMVVVGTQNGVLLNQTAALVAEITVTASKTFELYVKRQGTVWTVSQIGSDTNGYTKIDWVKTKP